GRHVRDRLEEHLPEPDRVLAQVVEATRLARGRGFHLIPPSSVLPVARSSRTQRRWRNRGEATIAAPGGVPEWPKGTGCKPVGSAYGGSNPPAPTRFAAAPLARLLASRGEPGFPPCRPPLD